MANSQRAAQQPRTVVRLEAYRPNPRKLSATGADTVGTEEVGARIRWVAKYIEWQPQPRLYSMEVNGQPIEPFKGNAEAAIKRLRALAPSVSGFLYDDKALGFKPNQLLDGERLF